MRRTPMLRSIVALLLATIWLEYPVEAASRIPPDASSEREASPVSVVVTGESLEVNLRHTSAEIFPLVSLSTDGEATDRFVGSIVTLVNRSSRPVGIVFVRLHDDSSLKDVRDAERQGQSTVATWTSLGTLAGGPGIAPPGGRSEAIVRLDPGRYATVLDDGTRSAGFEIVSIDPSACSMWCDPGGLGFDALPPPENEVPAEVSVTLQEFNLTVLPAVVPSRGFYLEMYNAGVMPHDLVIFPVPTGTTAEQAIDALTEGADFSLTGVAPVAGYGALDPAGQGVQWISLPVGTYAAYSMTIDADGQAGALKGMVAVLTVSD